MTGDYEEIVDILSPSEQKHEEMDQLVRDFAMIIETVERLDGATRSQIADSLPDSFSLDLTGEELVGLLRVLEFYDLVRLDQNTWKPTAE
ncbi:MAG: hypothetical protein ABEH65_10930 [Halobacteriales archaeon]